MGHRQRVLLVLLALLVLGTGALNAQESPPREWDQEEVVRLIEELVEAIRAVEADPGLTAPQQTALQQRKHDAALKDAKRLSTMVVDLSNRLSAGEGLRQTRAAFINIQTLRSSIRDYAEDSTFALTTRQKISAARDLLEKITPFYDLR